MGGEAEIISIVRDGGGSVGLGVLLVLAWRLVAKLISLLDKGEKLIDAVIADRPVAIQHRADQAAHNEAAESHLAAIRKALT